jgi:FlaA1/EpsC-like NDP-sugar epimerase
MYEVLRRCRLAIVFLADVGMIILSWLVTNLLYSNLNVDFSHERFPFLLYVTIQAAAFYVCGLYRGIWRFASISDLSRILLAVLIGSLVAIGLTELYSNVSFSRLIINNILLVAFLSAPRFLFRLFKGYKNFFSKGERVLIVGAGDAGEGLVRDLQRSIDQYGYKPVAFVDDNPSILGKEIHGIRVQGSSSDISKLVKQLQIQLILIALPSASSLQMRQVVQQSEKARIPFRTLPGLKDLTEGRISINELRDVSLEDLLGREQVQLAWEKIYSIVMNKVVLVTGGGGSIGSELCCQLCQLAPSLLIIVDNSEFNLYSIDLKLKQKYPNLNVKSVLCSVTDQNGIRNIFSTYKPSLIFHAAAYKHVPLLESQLRIALSNNIIGTRIVAEAAAEFNAEKFVLISTDKAVNPTNIMGATKRAAEIFCQEFNARTKTCFLIVRFGNVLESAGSVIPLFRQQLQKGGPLTVTHPEVTRYFMTIPEATQLIMQAAALDTSDGIFVLDMGEPVPIKYLAEQLISLSGRSLGKDIEIMYIGMRPGEKLHEELFYTTEELMLTSHQKIRRAKAQKYDWDNTVELLNKIEQGINLNDENNLINLLKKLVVEYQPIDINKTINKMGALQDKENA